MSTPSHDRTSTHDRIAHIAERAFAANGFEATRLADIAREAGIRRPSLLYWFPTKQALYAHVVNGAFAALEQALVHALDTEGAFTERVDRAAIAVHTFFEDAPQVAALIVHELTRDGGPGQAVLVERVIPLLGAVESRLADDAGLTRAGLPVRSAILTVIGGLLLRHATSNNVRDALWGPSDQQSTRILARSVFVAAAEESP